ncbi:MAG: hypothetical protein ACM30E_02825 [Nitrososphaerales archaeon]
MTEEPKVEEPIGEEPQAERSIADELAKLGQQLATAAQKAWESDERKRLQNEITTGVQRLGQELSGAMSKAAESDQAKELKTRATKVAEDVQKTDVIDEVRKGLLVGLEAINRELGKLLERMEPKAGEAEVAAPVTDTAAGETVVVAETPVVPDITPDEENPVA